MTVTNSKISNQVATLDQMVKHLHISGTRKIRIFLKPNHVTMDCTVNGRKHGSKGDNLDEALERLFVRLHNPESSPIV
ncbi:MAG: hypothetical protein IPO86_09895 [Saprospiraceae bacterium]|nr:hypothetical protein [Saprospiraceae bacterium]